MDQGVLRLGRGGDEPEVLANGDDRPATARRRWLWGALALVLLTAAAWQPVTFRLDAVSTRAMAQVVADARATLKAARSAGAALDTRLTPDDTGLRSAGIAALGRDQGTALHTFTARLRGVHPVDRALRRIRGRLLADARRDLANLGAAPHVVPKPVWPHRLADDTALAALTGAEARWHVGTRTAHAAALPRVDAVLAQAKRYTDTITGLRVVTAGPTGQTLVDVDASRERPIRLVDASSERGIAVLERPAATFVIRGDLHVQVVTDPDRPPTVLPIRAEGLWPGTRPDSVWLLPITGRDPGVVEITKNTRLVEIDATGHLLRRAAVVGDPAAGGRLAVDGPTVRDMVTGKVLGRLPVPAAWTQGGLALAIFGVGAGWVAWSPLAGDTRDAGLRTGYAPAPNDVHLYEVTTGRDRTLASGAGDPVAATSPDGRYLAVSTGTGRPAVLLFDGRTSAIQQLSGTGLGTDDMRIDTVLWAPDSRSFVLGRGTAAPGGFDLLYARVGDARLHWLRHRGTATDTPLLVFG